MNDRIDLREFVGGFIAESDELVATSNTALLAIEAAHQEGSTRPRAVRDLFRALHTIKGLAGMIGVEPIVEIAHALETVVRNADRAGGQLARVSVEHCRHGVDAISERIRAIAEGRTPERAPVLLLEAIASTGAPPDLAPTSRIGITTRMCTVTFYPSDAHATRGITIAAVRAQLGAIGEIHKVAPKALPRSETVPAGIAFEILLETDADVAALAHAGATTPDAVRELAPLGPPPAAIGGMPASIEPAESLTGIARPIVRVELARLDALQEQLSLLIVSRFRLQREVARQAELGIDVKPLREILEQQGRQLRDLRRAILAARLVRATEVLEPLALLVRSLARTSGKEITLAIDAGTSELDKSVADRLFPALVHLVRNAVDHAIEPRDERLALGKPASGSLRIGCHEVAGNQLELVITDDGRGIDRTVIARKARRPIDDPQDLLDVITQPGFSTRQTVTETSGRGLGMDIVRRIVVGDLRGELSLVTGDKLGTTFTLRVPVTIAVVDVFSFVCAEQTFVVPVSTVEEIFEIDATQLVEPPGHATRSFSLVQRRGRAIPLVPLGQLLALANATPARKALVIKKSGEAIAFGIDRMLGRQEVVVRAIDDPLVQIPGIAGATDLGDGFPTIVLDLLALDGTHRERTV